LAHGYWQIGLDEKSKQMTAFSTPDGHYEFNKMPFGLKNAPAEFSRTMQTVFGDKSDTVIFYMDDFYVYSYTFDQRCEAIMDVGRTLAKAKLKLKPSKFKWFAKKINVLGHVVSRDGVAMDPEKIKAISE